MPSIQAGDIGDVVIGILDDLGRLKWTDLTTDLQDYPAVNQLMKKKKVDFLGGTNIQWNVMVDHNNSARFVGLGSVDVVNQQDVMKTAEIPWRHVTANWSIEERVIAMNRGDEYRVIDLVKTARISGMVALVKLLEERFWQKPTDSTDTVNIFGIPYWCVPSATEGFNGTNPSGFTSGAGGLSSTTYPRWANYTARYVSVTKTDLLRKLRRAMTKTQFKAPVDMPQYGNSISRGLYTNYDVVGPCEELLEAQNDNLGNDLASKDGKCVFRGVPLTDVPYLDDGDTTNPVYGLDWNTMKPVCMRGEFMKEMGPKIAPRQHRTLEWFVDISMNLECRDRRKQFVINTA